MGMAYRQLKTYSSRSHADTAFFADSAKLCGYCIHADTIMIAESERELFGSAKENRKRHCQPADQMAAG